jgi:predicted pyridoxine 5'-phosphate oxidase superfamily flavin-nucleotide-binding protein
MRIESPFHAGERMVQSRAGELQSAERNGRMIGSIIPPGAVRFIEERPMAILGSSDGRGRIWASVLIGEPGFLHVTDARTVEMDVSQPLSSREDPIWAALGSVSPVGMLVIDLATRRRLRVNGRIGTARDGRLRLEVERAYANCPKYIQRRVLANLGELSGDDPDGFRRGNELGKQQKALIGSSDTFFVASGNAADGLDASHRGGPPGFVRVLSDRRLRIPDYAGNSMFNTMGNLVSSEKAGVAFLDFENSRALQLTGRAWIQWDQADDVNETGGTHRFWGFEIESWIESPLARRLRWELLDRSPHNPEPRYQPSSTGAIEPTDEGRNHSSTAKGVEGCHSNLDIKH